RVARLIGVPLLTLAVWAPTSASAAPRPGAAVPRVPTTSVPFNRAQASMAFDEGRHVTLMFGGEYFGAFMNDTWAWNGTKWSLQFPKKSPSPRGGQGMVYDPIRRQIVMFGGYDGNAYLNDTWAWNGRA